MMSPLISPEDPLQPVVLVMKKITMRILNFDGCGAGGDSADDGGGGDDGGGDG